MGPAQMAEERSLTDDLEWVVEGAYATDGTNLWVITERSDEFVMLEDACEPEGDLQPPFQVALSDVALTMRSVIPSRD